MTFEKIEEFILSLGGVNVSQPFKENLVVYNLGPDETTMFALINQERIPLRLSLRCDPELAKLLRDKYEEVMPGEHLDAKKWNTIILSGQLGEAEIKDLIRHSFELVKSDFS